MLPSLTAALESQRLPDDIDGREFQRIAEITPVLVRKSSVNPWQGRNEVATRAQEVFDEADGVHSFYRIESANDLAAVAAFMTRNQKKLRAAYFFALPSDLIPQHVLRMEQQNADGSRCYQINRFHLNVAINVASREDLFQAILVRHLYNYRVDVPAILDMVNSLRNWKCLDHTDGPCRCNGRMPVEAA